MVIYFFAQLFISIIIATIREQKTINLKSSSLAFLPESYKLVLLAGLLTYLPLTPSRSLLRTVAKNDQRLY